MAREFNPVPEIFSDDPDAGSGDFLDGLIIDRSKTFKPTLTLEQDEQKSNTIPPQQENTSVVPENPNQ